jgi:hypothetical protein
VTFPVKYHTHSRQQVFYFSADGLLRRQDYTAEEFGKRAYAAHYCFDHRAFGGLLFPTRRRVFLRRPDGHPRPWPLLIWIDIQAVDIAAKDSTSPADLGTSIARRVERGDQHAGALAGGLHPDL